MIARFGIVRKMPELSQEAFSHHWKNVHGPLAAEMPGLRNYWQHEVVNKDQFGISQTRGAWDVDGFSELHFDDFDAMMGAVTAPMYGGTVVDEGNVFADVHVVAGEKHVVVPVATGEGPHVKRMTLLRRAPGMSDDDFRHEWLTVHADMVRRWPDVLGYVQNIVTHRYHTSRTETLSAEEMPIDGIVEFWFRDTETAAKLYASDIVARSQDHAVTFLSEITPFFVETRQIV